MVENRRGRNPTSIWLSREERQILAVAGAIFNLTWSAYLRKVGLEHARSVLASAPPIIRIDREERIAFDDHE
jgi:hypothetical protein